MRNEHPVNRQSSTDVSNPVVKVAWGDELIKISANDAVNNVLYMIENCYTALINAGIAKECARDILPLCTKTTIHITGTLRDLLGFLNTRHTSEAQKEIRDIAYEIGLALENEIPEIMQTINWREGYFM